MSWHTRSDLLLLSLVLAVTSGCRQQPPRAETSESQVLPGRGEASQGETSKAEVGEPWFRDVTEHAQLDFVHKAGFPDDKYFMPRVLGSGAALLDVDNDDLLDLYLLQNGGPQGPPNRLFRQREDHTFEDITDGCGLDVAGWAQSTATGDVNNDGRTDSAVPAKSDREKRLCRRADRRTNTEPGRRGHACLTSSPRKENVFRSTSDR